MGGGYQAEVANGKHNLWDEELAFIEPESEHSAASTCEGFAVSGGRVTNFTSGQGLILMKEVLYTISGKRLPVVFHIGARALMALGLAAALSGIYPLFTVLLARVVLRERLPRLGLAGVALALVAIVLISAG